MRKRVFIVIVVIAVVLFDSVLAISFTKIDKIKKLDDEINQVKAAPTLQVPNNTGLFFEDFETGEKGWKVINGEWEIGSPIVGPSSAYSGTSCAGTNLRGDYLDDAVTRLVSPTISLPPLSRRTDRIRMHFRHWYAMEEDCDFGYVQMSTDNGKTWSILGDSVTGVGEAWYVRSIDLTSYSGRDINIAFYFTSDGSNTDSGWYIDDILIEYLDSIATESLEIIVASNGQFAMGIPGSSILLFGYPDPWSSATTIRIDGNDYWNFIFSNWGAVVTPSKTTGLSNISVWDVDKIRFTQTLSIVEGSTTGKMDTTEIKYTIVNTDIITHEVGIRVMLDTMLGENDGAPFRVPKIGGVITEYEFLKNNIPMYWQAFDDLSLPTFQSQGTLTGGLATIPDRFVTVGWSHINQEPWDCEIVSGQDFDYGNIGYYDSAVGIYWFPVKILPGESKEFITYYGLGGIDIDVQPPLVVGLTAPEKLITIDGVPSSNVFTLTAYLENSSSGVTKTAQGITTELVLPKGLNFTANEKAVHNIPDLVINEGAQTSYNITATGESEGALSYSLVVTAANIITKTVSKDVYVFGVKISPQDGEVINKGATIGAIFKIDMDASTLNEKTFTVTSNDSAISGRISYSSSTRTVAFKPQLDLKPNKFYTAILTTGIRSSTGISLPHDIIWHFSTSAIPEILELISQKSTIISSLEEIYTVAPIMGLWELDWKTGYDETNVKTLLKNWEATYPSLNDLDRTEALKRLLLFENALKDIFYRKPDVLGAKTMAEDTMGPVVDAALITLNGIRVIKKTNQYLQGVPWLRGWADKLTYRIANLLLSLFLNTARAIISVAAPDSQTGKIIDEAIGDIHDIIIKGESSVIYIIAGETLTPIGAFVLLDKGYIGWKTQPALNAALDKASKLDYSETFSRASSDVNAIVNDVSYKTSVLHNELMAIRQGLAIPNKIADLSEVAGMIPGLQLLIIVAKTIQGFTIATYAIEAGKNGYYLLNILPEQVNDAVSAVFQTGDPSMDVAKFETVSSGNQAPAKELFARFSQASQSYEDILQQTITAIQNNDRGTLKYLIPQLMKADEELQFQISNAWSPMMGIAHQALDSIPKFEASFVNSIDKQLSSSLERILLYSQILAFLEDMNNNELKDEIISQASTVKKANGIAEQSIVEASSLSFGLQDHPVIIMSSYSMLDELNSDQNYIIKATIENIGVGIAKDVNVSLSSRPNTLINISSPVVTVGAISQGEKKEAEWKIKAGQFVDGTMGSLNVQIEVSNGLVTPFNKAVFFKNIGPTTGGKLFNKNVYAYPNPFNPEKGSASIRYSLSKDANATIEIYDANSDLVATIIKDQPKEKAVEYSEHWDGRNKRGDVVANGIYFYLITTTNGEKAVGKIAVLR